VSAQVTRRHWRDHSGRGCRAQHTRSQRR